MRWYAEYYDPTNHAAGFVLMMLVVSVMAIGLASVVMGSIPWVVWIGLGFGVALFMVVASFPQSNHEVHVWIEDGWLEIDARKRLKIDLNQVERIEVGQLGALYTLDVTYRSRQRGWQVRLSANQRDAQRIVDGVCEVLSEHRERYGTPEDLPRELSELVQGSRQG